MKLWSTSHQLTNAVFPASSAGLQLEFIVNHAVEFPIEYRLRNALRDSHRQVENGSINWMRIYDSGLISHWGSSKVQHFKLQTLSLILWEITNNQTFFSGFDPWEENPKIIKIKAPMSKTMAVIRESQILSNQSFVPENWGFELRKMR